MEQQVEKKVGLFGGTAFLVGCVIGAGIFVMTGPLAGEIGPGLYIGYMLALLTAIGQALAFAQLGSAIPTTSSAYSYISMFYHSALGFVGGWGRSLANAAMCALLAEGFAQYFCAVFPNANEMVVACSLLIMCTLIHIAGIKSAEMVQTLMTVFLVVALAIFVIGGLPAMNPEFAQPLFPRGLKPLVGAASTLFYAFTGFNMITDIGEEVDNPGSTIPLCILIGAAIIGGLYIGTSYVLPRIIHWKELAQTEVGLVEAAAVFLPPWGRTMMILAGLMAVFTSINAGVAMSSRLWYAMGRDGWLPESLTKTLDNGAPHVALIVTLISGLVILFTKWGIVHCGTLGSLNLLIQTALIAWATMMLPNRFPEEYKKAPFKIPLNLLRVLATVTSIMCLTLVITGFMSFPSIVVAFVAWIVPGLILYKVRSPKVQDN